MEIGFIAVAFFMGLIAHRLGLPALIGYLLAGFVLNSMGFSGGEGLAVASHIGVLLLLFSVGLKLRLKSLLRAEVLAGSLIHLAVIAGIFSAIIIAVGALEPKYAVILAVSLGFSSTVVAAKVLESKRELRAFHGRVAIGILIMQDLVAVATLSFAGQSHLSPWTLLVLLIPLARPIVHRLLDATGHDELLILFGLLLALVVGGLGFEHAGLSSELGALLLGAMLADHRRASEVADSLWALKEVFLVGFFLQIGMAGIPTLNDVLIAGLLTLALPLKTVLFFFLLIAFRLRARSSFLAALALGTYSEFGLIVANLGVQAGWLTPDWLVLLAITVALSFLWAAPLNRVAHDIYERYGQRLQRFESDQRHPDDEPIALGNSHWLVMGMGRVGTGAYDFLTRRKQRVVGLDSDPGKVESQRGKGRRVLYADAEDPDFWRNLNLAGINAVLLAMPEFEANAFAARQLRKSGYQGFVGATAVFPEQIEALREAGVNAAYNYYDEVGVGYAEHVWEELNPEAPDAQKG